MYDNLIVDTTKVHIRGSRYEYLVTDKVKHKNTELIQLDKPCKYTIQDRFVYIQDIARIVDKIT